MGLNLFYFHMTSCFRASCSISERKIPPGKFLSGFVKVESFEFDEYFYNSYCFLVVIKGLKEFGATIVDVKIPEKEVH